MDDSRNIVVERNRLVHTFGALAELGQEISTKQNFGETVRNSLDLLLGSLGIMRGAVTRFERFGCELNTIAMRGLGETFPLTISLSAEDARRLAKNELRPLDHAQARELRSLRSLETGLARIEIFVPLVIRDELFGAVFLGEKASGDLYSSYELEVVAAMSRHIAVAISQRNLMAELERQSNENRRLYERLRMTYNDTVEAFAAAIDRKDKYTEGHSVRVGKYSAIIAAEMGWGEPEVEGAAVAGYLHDVGKITVERKIINAPYRIDARASSELNRHPRTGYDILTPIDHPYADVPLAAKYHHERLDGKGYPDGLIDREIPLIAKIVCVADSFDAMTTDRPYRRRRQPEKGFDDLVQNSGTQFDPAALRALLAGLYAEATGSRSQKQFRRLLGREFMETPGLVPMIGRALAASPGLSP